VAWSSALIGDLPQVLESSAAAMALIQPGQNAGFSVGCASWYAYAEALIGGWEALSSTLDWLRARWFEAERPAASYGLQGPLSGIDWARNRSDEDQDARWGEVVGEMGADRYAARVRRELGRLTDDDQLRGRGDRELEELGELLRLKRLGGTAD